MLKLLERRSTLCLPALVALPDFLNETYHLGQGDPPAEAHRYLVEGWQREAGLLLDQLIDRHAQEDDAHPIAHTCNSSTALCSCNKIEHHSDSYYVFC